MTEAGAQGSAGLVAAARARVRDLSADALAKAQAAGALVVDVRERDELRASGIIPGALHVPRGVLEFVADPASPQHHPAFERARPVVLYCAVGGRSALAADALRQLGFTDVAHLGDGFTGWAADGRPTASVGAESDAKPPR